MYARAWTIGNVLVTAPQAFEGLYSYCLKLFTYLYKHPLTELQKFITKQSVALTKVRNPCNGFQYKKPCIISVTVQSIKYLYDCILEWLVELN